MKASILQGILFLTRSWYENIDCPFDGIEEDIAIMEWPKLSKKGCNFFPIEPEEPVRAIFI